MRRSKKEIEKQKKKIIAYGYVGTWDDGTLGWHVPQFLVNDLKGKHIEKPTVTNPSAKGCRAILCKITIETVNIKGKRLYRKIKAEY